MVSLERDKENGSAVLSLIRSGLVSCVHDCSKGGLAIALAEMAVAGNTGLRVQIDSVPSTCTRIDELLFSESHSRFLIGTAKPDQVSRMLQSKEIKFAQIGKSFSHSGGRFELMEGKKMRISLPLSKLENALKSLWKIMG